MAINISQAFHRTSGAPIDDTLTLTKAEMLTVNDNLMPAKYLTVCQDDGKIYLYDKSATPSPTTGKFSVFEGGGSGVSSYNDLTDQPSVNGNTLSGNKTNSQLGIPTALSEMTDDATHRTVTDTQMTAWNGKQNAITAGTNLAFDGNTLNASMPMLDYSTTEHIVGKWIDGKPLYQKTISGTVTKSSDGNEVTTRINIGASVANVIKIDGFVKGGPAIYALNTAKIKNSVVTVLRTTANDNTSDTYPNVVTISNNLFGTSDTKTYTAYVTLQYTKTTD